MGTPAGTLVLTQSLRTPRARRRQSQYENNNAPPLFEIDELPAPTTWVLLFTSSYEGLFAELSCPTMLGADGRITTWSERIILGRIDLGETDLPVGIPESGPQAPIEVAVTRRSS